MKNKKLKSKIVLKWIFNWKTKNTIIIKYRKYKIKKKRNLEISKQKFK